LTWRVDGVGIFRRPDVAVVEAPVVAVVPVAVVEVVVVVSVPPPQPAISSDVATINTDVAKSFGLTRHNFSCIVGSVLRSCERLEELAPQDDRFCLNFPCLRLVPSIIVVYLTLMFNSRSCSSVTSSGAPVIRSVPVWVFGKAITSRIVARPARIITKRSSPKASPPCGGAP
jgi:hypothetical protein